MAHKGFGDFINRLSERLAVNGGAGLTLLALAYGVIMNSAYAMLHEAEHNLLHPDRRVNDLAGAALALFFPAPFHLLRQGHISHHWRNRSDDEAFDVYFYGDSPLWKHLQLYGILTGLFWLTIVITNVIALLAPAARSRMRLRFDRPTSVLLESLNPRYAGLIRVEAALVFLLHGALMVFGRIPPLNYVLVLAGFGVSWSAMQYVHHYGTVRDVRRGARNLKTLWLLDRLWLNHNWHLNHHLHPTVPWIHLPRLPVGAEGGRGSLIVAYLRMWRGPRYTCEHVENRYAGQIIR